VKYAGIVDRPSRLISKDKMKILKIMGYNYRCRIVDKEDLSNMGTCDARNQIIRLAAESCDQGVESTIIHEMIEAINFHLQLSLEHNKIMSLEAALHQALTANGVCLRPLLDASGWNARKKAIWKKKTRRSKGH